MHGQQRLVQFDGRKLHGPRQRPHVGQAKLEPLESQQVLVLGVGQLDAAELDRAAQPHRRRGGLLERELHVGVEHGGLQVHGQRGRHVAQIGGQIHGLQRQAGVGLAGLGKRRAARRRIKGAAVELERQQRIGMDVPFGIQVAQEGHCEPQVAHGVRLAHRVIDEIERAAVQREVVEGKLRRFARRLVGRRCELLEHVVDVVAAPPQVGQPGHGPVHRDGVHHRRHPHQGLQFPIYIDTLDPHLVGLAVGGGDGQVRQGEFHRPGLEIHSPQGHRAPELLAGDLLDLVLEQRRHRQPADHPEGHHAPDRPGAAPRPFVPFECLQVHGSDLPTQGPKANGATTGDRCCAKKEPQEA